MAVGLLQPMMPWSGTPVSWPRTEPGPQCSAWHLSALKKDFSKEVKSSEASNVLIRREDRCRESTGRLRERHEHWGSSGFPLVHIWSDSGPFPVCVHTFSQDRFKHKGLWEVDRTCYGLAPWESFLGMCSLGVSLTSRMRNMWSLYLLSKRYSTPPWCCHHPYLEVSVHKE